MFKRLFFPLDDPQQVHRMRRFLMGAAATGMVLVLLTIAAIAGLLPREAVAVAAVMMVVLVLAFFTMFRLGFNKHFPDPSLTLPQVVASTIVILYCLYQSPANHGTLYLIYMVSFLFGVFRLNTRELLGITAFVAVTYGAILMVRSFGMLDTGKVGENMARWLVLVTVLTFFSVMGGYMSRLRKNLSDTNEQLESAMLRIEHLAARDELTGVLNRRSLIEALTQQKGRADRYGAKFSVLMVDIDFFKRVNDTYGHLAGDAVLMRFAREAAESLRQSDSFGRYGGEEFLAILDETPVDGSRIVADRFCQLARQLRFTEFDDALRISVSVGYAEYRPKETWQVLVERADHALYRAKDGGRNRAERESPPEPVVQEVVTTPS